MSWRAIQDSVAASESLSRVSHGAERLYWRILAATDSHGRLSGGVAKVRAQCLPLVKARDGEIAHWLDELEEVGRILRYTAQGRECIQVSEFEQNQPTEFLRKRGQSRFPAPPKKSAFAGDSRTRPEKAVAEEKERRRELNVPNGTSSASVPTGDASPCSPSNNGAVDRDAVQTVYDHWRTALSKSDKRYAAISPARRQKITTRLREFEAAELCRAIDAVAADDWPERHRHDDLTVIFRNREKVDYWLERATDASTLTPAERLRARMAERGIE